MARTRPLLICRPGLPAALPAALSKSRSRLLRTLFAALLALASACGSPAATGTFTTLARGTHSGITAQEAALITSLAEWEALWRRHASRFDPPPALPPVDFSRSSVVALFAGERPTGGYSLYITDVAPQGDSLRVTALELRPAPGRPVTQAVTQPYHVIAVPRVKKDTRLEVRWRVRTDSAGLPAGAVLLGPAHHPLDGDALTGLRRHPAAEPADHLMDLRAHDQRVGARHPLEEGLEEQVDLVGLPGADAPGAHEVRGVILEVQVVVDLRDPTVHHEAIFVHAGPVGPAAAQVEADRVAALHA
ncbi:hypothetical protein STH595 [Symbiobacterium thermophilum IAM 14863]|uniref:PrcB C-terminal domain-containing protein n=2 Tax=Symbiobacterium thermophilum TaxID=2734 RepID=Q67RW3_SYMTH|nr:hypothetical protein STH595 [Symbiobacterium thermophilum IAM 14863]